jgi:hypothetical protein
MRGIIIAGMIPTVGLHMSAGRILERANDITTALVGHFDLLPVVKEVD